MMNPHSDLSHAEQKKIANQAVNYWRHGTKWKIINPIDDWRIFIEEYEENKFSFDWMYMWRLSILRII